MPAVGRNEDAIRSYIRQQEKKDARLDQLNLWCRHHLQVVPKSGPRQRPRTAASSGSSRNAPGFAGGYLLAGAACAEDPDWAGARTLARPVEAGSRSAAVTYPVGAGATAG